MLNETILKLRQNRDFMSQVMAWERLPARAASEVAFDDDWPDSIITAVNSRNIHSLYTHQVDALNAIRQYENVIIATATASGKSICYTVPVLTDLWQRPLGRALYLFPTKALAQDQLAETRDTISGGALPINANTYDGDTPQSQRRTVRTSPGIIISNPDMLHASILPSHPKWRDFFQNLRFIVLDEVHVYRGVFGSHVANVLRRLIRICEFYGSTPQFICCSATIANPKEHAERLLERPFTLIDESQNGAPRGEKQFILYNPPIIDEQLGLRGSSVLAARDAAITFLAEDIQTVVFARARQTVELLLNYLQDDLAYAGYAETAVAGYRGGYLPLERRNIEQGLRNGEIRGVVATNALELGIDIGQLDAAVITGYPGSIASVWQQSGRAGRNKGQSIAIMVASNNPLDQYICNHPRYLFGQAPESALTNPDNLQILVKHLLCAAFELPFQPQESFGSFDAVDEVLNVLAEEGQLHQSGQQYHYIGDGSPTAQFSLRTSGDDTVVIQSREGERQVVIGEADLASVPVMLYEGAIYMHQAMTYLVEMLDWNGRIAYVTPTDVDYYTRANMSSTIRELRPYAEQAANGVMHHHGEVTVVSQATNFRKIKRYTHETLGYGNIDLPEMSLETDGYWLVFSEALTEELYDAGILLRPIDYGPNWQLQRQKVLERDEYQCQTCGAESREGAPLHVHHIRPFREFDYIPGVNENYLEANKTQNLITLCPSCHRRAEAGQQARSALGGFSYVIRNLAPLFLMCDPSDIEVLGESRNPITKAPTIVVYERISAGVGFSEKLFDIHQELLNAALELVNSCRCRDGCPA
ncbi:MAG: DEAD/DEAH box helicase, partial [Chloroflexota bacterium]